MHTIYKRIPTRCFSGIFEVKFTMDLPDTKGSILNGRRQKNHFRYAGIAIWSSIIIILSLSNIFLYGTLSLFGTILHFFVCLVAIGMIFLKEYCRKIALAIFTFLMIFAFYAFFNPVVYRNYPEGFRLRLAILFVFSLATLCFFESRAVKSQFRK